jgi:hypothetical protein
MGKRDYRRRESKKPKKGATEAKPLSEVLPPAEVEVIGKKRKKPTAEEVED